MSTLKSLPEEKVHLQKNEEQLLSVLFANCNRILHDENYHGDKSITFRDLHTNESYRLEARELSLRHLEEIVKNTIKVEENGDYLMAYLRLLYPDKQFTFSLYGDNAKHIVCELQAELLGTCVVGVAKPNGGAVYLLARQLPLGFEEALINRDMDFYGSRKSYRDYAGYILEVLCSKKNLAPTAETAATTDYEEVHRPTKEELFNARTKPVVTNVKKIREKFLLATDSEREVPVFHRKPADVIDISKIERDVRENICLFYWPAQQFFDCHPLDLTLEELIAIYQHDIFIAYNEQSFYKYETVIRIAHGMKP